MKAAVPGYYLLGCFLALVSGVVSVGLLACGTGGCATFTSEGEGSAELLDQASSFTIAGDTHRPMAPGVKVPLNLWLTNDNDFAITATHLEVAVRSVSAPRADGDHPCTVDDFEVKQPSRGLEIRLTGNTTSSLRSHGVRRGQWPHVGMLNRSVNQDGCKGASLSLSYRASGMQVGR